MTIFYEHKEANLPARIIELEGEHYIVPRGIARNNRNQSWQLRVTRYDEVVADGNFADGVCGGTQEALEEAVEALIKSGAHLKVSKKVRGTTPSAFFGDLRLRWYVVNATPALRAVVYDPLGRKQKQIHIGSDTSFGDQEKTTRAFVNLLTALTFIERIKSGDQDPFRDVTREEAKSNGRMDAVKKIMSSPTFTGLVREGMKLRANAERARGAERGIRGRQA